MAIYTNNKGTLNKITEIPIKLEKEIQSLFEKNLSNILGYELVKSEFTIKNKRIDTLAFDPQNNSFIIIEYKKGKNISVVDQGFAYLGLMMENGAEFLVEYNETLNKQLKRSDIDWSQTRVVFVSTSFTENQRLATNFSDLAIDLWEIKTYKDNIVSIQQVKKSKTAGSIKPITQQNKKLNEIQKKIKVYTEEDHFKDRSEELIELYESYKNAIIYLKDDIETIAKKVRISFELEKKIICDIALQKKQIKMWINLKKGQLDDPKNIMRDVADVGHWGRGDR